MNSKRKSMTFWSAFFAFLPELWVAKRKSSQMACKVPRWIPVLQKCGFWWKWCATLSLHGAREGFIAHRRGREKTSLTLMLMPLMPSAKNFKRRCAKFRESFRTKHKITREQPKRTSDSNSTPLLFDYKQCAGISFVVHPHTSNHKIRFKNIVISTTVLQASGHNSASKNPRRRRVLRTHPRRFSSGQFKLTDT